MMRAYRPIFYGKVKNKIYQHGDEKDGGCARCRARRVRGANSKRNRIAWRKEINL